jgi:hypothetical protein
MRVLHVISQTKGITRAGDVQDQVAEEDGLTQGERSNRKLEKTV